MSCQCQYYKTVSIDTGRGCGELYEIVRKTNEKDATVWYDGVRMILQTKMLDKILTSANEHAGLLFRFNYAFIL